jgi:HD-like signal output (HDOD) protein
MPALLTSKRFEMQSLSLHAAKLPPSPQVFGRLVAAINDGNSSLDRMAELVRLDATLTTQLLRIANSVMFGFRSQATNVEEAVLRVGLKELHRIVGLCAASLAFQADMRVYATTAETLWGNAVTTAVAMEKLCLATGGDAALGYTAGLLRSIGKMVLARHAVGTVAPYPDEGTPLPEWEQATFGANHAQIGASLCELWRFPKPIAAAIRDHLQPAANPNAIALAHLLNLAGLLAERLERGLPGEAGLWAKDPVRFEKTGIDDQSLDVLQAETLAEVDRMRSMLAVIREG